MRTLIVCILATAGLAAAQDNPLTAFNKRSYGQLKTWLLGSAEKMPAENYAWQPTDSIRKFGQLVGHVADAQYFFCSAVLGEKNPAPGIEQSKTSKADLIASLKSSFAYCDKAYDGMTDATATQTRKFFGNDMTKFAVLETNLAHCSEHYGNMVTYLRLKNIVPPSSEQAPPPPPKK